MRPPPTEPRSPHAVMPAELSAALPDTPWWFVIGGQAVRCCGPSRPTRDVDLGVRDAASLSELLAGLQAAGSVRLLERSERTAHLIWDGINVSVFVLDRLVPHTDGRRLSLTGILATKLHAILDRGRRRDFFDLYVMLQNQRLGIAACLRAMREVYAEELNEDLLLRALTYFDDAEREAPLPGEGPGDWRAVCDFFLRRVGELLVPPGRCLDIQEREVDVHGAE